MEMLEFLSQLKQISNTEFYIFLYVHTKQLPNSGTVPVEIFVLYFFRGFSATELPLLSGFSILFSVEAQNLVSDESSESIIIDHNIRLPFW